MGPDGHCCIGFGADGVGGSGPKQLRADHELAVDAEGSQLRGYGPEGFVHHAGGRRLSPMGDKLEPEVERLESAQVEVVQTGADYGFYYYREW